MDLVFETIKKAVKALYGDQIDYSKTYRMSCIAFNPISQSITGQSFDEKMNLIVEAPLYGVGIWYSIITPGTEYLLTFENADPGKPVAIGLRFKSPGKINTFPIPLVPPAPPVPVKTSDVITIGIL